MAQAASNNVKHESVHSTYTLPPAALASMEEKHTATSMLAPTEIQHHGPRTATLYRVEEIAKELACSLSYVYALIAKHKPHVYARDGKAFLYSDEFLKEMKKLPRRNRQQRVKVITQKATQASTLVASEQQKQKNFLDRMQDMEQNIHEMSRAIEQIKQALGI